MSSIEQYLLMSNARNKEETKMNQNDSKLDFLRCLKEINKEKEDDSTLLKAKLDLECTTFTMIWGSDPSDIGPQKYDPSELGFLPSLKECGPSELQNKDMIIVAAGAPYMPLKPVVTIRSTTSGSSGEEKASQGEVNMNGDKNPDAKRVKRESAKRSRTRKIAQNTELQTQVSTLRGDNSSLLNRLSDVNQKYNNSVVENRILNADFDTIKAKVNAAKERCKRLTGSIPAFNAMPMSEASSMGMPLLDGSPSELSADAYVPVQEDPNNFIFQPTFNNPMSSYDMRGVNNGLGGIISSVESVWNIYC